MIFFVQINEVDKGVIHLESLGNVMDESIKWVGGVFRVH